MPERSENFDEVREFRDRREHEQLGFFEKRHAYRRDVIWDNVEHVVQEDAEVIQENVDLV